NPLAGQIGTLAGRIFGRPDDALQVTAPPPSTPAIAAALPSAPTLAARVAPPVTPVELGIDVLRSEGFARLARAHVGLLTNASGRASDGARTLDLLRRAPRVTLVALFAPEHGLLADVDRKIESGTDETTSLPVHSLYGDALAPTSAMLAGIDTL